MKALICGAGIAGLALSHRLVEHGWDVTVIDVAPGPRGTGYMIDFFGLGYDAAQRMGVLPAILELGYHVTEAAYVDDGGRRRAGLSFDRFSDTVGGRLSSIMRPDLERALREAVVDLVDLRYGTSVSGFEQDGDGVRVSLTDGSEAVVDLLVGADGIHSAVRRLAFGPEERFLRYLGFHTAAFVFRDPVLHGVLADRFSLTDTVDRQMGFYGLRDGRVATFAVHREPDPTLPQDPREALLRTYQGMGWITQTALAQCPPANEMYYDQVAQVEAPEWSRGRVVLVGDACHAVSLLAGQGASLGIAGPFVLADQLARSTSIETALARYEEVWKPVVTAKQEVARKGMQWFLPENRRQLVLRRLMLWTSSLPVVKHVVGTALVGKSGASLEELSAAGDRGGRRQVGQPLPDPESRRCH